MPSPDSKYVLAIDLGTSGPKVALFSAAGRLVGSDFEPVPLHLFEGGGAEQSPADWWRGVTAAARRLTARFPEEAKRVAGVGVTAQWSGTVAIDSDLQPIGNAIIWMDTRGAPYVRRMVAGIPSVMGYGAAKLWKWVRLTGGIPGGSGKDSIGHILFLRHERPEIFERAFKLLEPKDYLNVRLTGKVAASYDSIALHWVTDNRDPDRVDYDPGLLQATGLPRAKLPDLKRAVDVLGPVLPEAARELGIPEGAQVVLGTPDVHSAALGSGAVRDYETHYYVGTSSWLTSHVPFKKTDPIHNMATLISAQPGRYLIGNTQECAGVCLTFLRDLFYAQDHLGSAPAPASIYQTFDKMAEEVPPGSRGILFTPWLYGERTPVEDPHIRGGFHHVSLRSTRKELVRAVYEGVALNARWLLEAVQKFTGRKISSLNMIGGGAKSDVWCQIHADALGVEVRQAAAPIDANARGAAILAAVGLGLGTFEELGANVEIKRTYAPHAERAKTYDGLFREFVSLYRANRGIHARLSRGA